MVEGWVRFDLRCWRFGFGTETKRRPPHMATATRLKSPVLETGRYDCRLGAPSDLRASRRYQVARGFFEKDYDGGDGLWRAIRKC